MKVFFIFCRYKYNDSELVKILDIYDDVLQALSKGVIPEDVIPPLQYVWESKKMGKLKAAFDEIMNNFLRKKYKEHVETFDKGIRLYTNFNGSNTNGSFTVADTISVLSA